VAAPAPEDQPPDERERPLGQRVWRFLIGGPRSLSDRSLFHRLSLVPFLAWVGFGADGLSSSAYGPEEAFRALGEHTYLAVVLAAFMATTVFVISAAYSRIIEEFPHGGGGYVVASKLLGPRVGVVSGSALLVDYVLTITISIAAAGDALFSFLPSVWYPTKLLMEVALIGILTALNIRGIRESVLSLTPVFLLFLGTHVLIIGYGIIVHASDLGPTADTVRAGFDGGLATVGAGGLAVLLLHAYSLGGGTYTGIEAISNGLLLMREPRVQTARRTMAYMAYSLAFIVTGLLLCYLLWGVSHVPGKTMNAVLIDRVVHDLPFGTALVVLTLFSEGALLIVAAQTGFMGGPRVLAAMAVDSWMPHRFGALSDRLTTQNGLVLMGAASLGALLYTGGNVRHIVVMYSINVFLTFSLSMLAMSTSLLRTRSRRAHWKRKTVLFVVGFALCSGILVVTVLTKFREGGWITLSVTGSLILLCATIRRHYANVGRALAKLFRDLEHIALGPPKEPRPFVPLGPTAAVLVGSYGGIGIHTTFNIFRAFPDHFKNLVFLSVGVIDSGGFKGEDAIERLREETESTMQKYLELARRMGVPATSRIAIGTDAVEEAEKLCLSVYKEFARTTFFAGKVIFGRERWYQRLLHNETALAVQRRLQWAGITMVVMPARVEG
jgi:amino acid transporter